MQSYVTGGHAIKIGGQLFGQKKLVVNEKMLTQRISGPVTKYKLL